METDTEMSDANSSEASVNFLTKSNLNVLQKSKPKKENLIDSKTLKNCSFNIHNYQSFYLRWSLLEVKHRNKHKIKQIKQTNITNK